MGDFAIVGEGVTDQIILKNILVGYFQDHDPEPLIVFEQPPWTPPELPDCRIRREDGPSWSSTCARGSISKRFS
jgi:hypothetical protein